MEKTALITGASSGIGLALANVFAVHGYNLVLVARNQETLQSTSDTLKKKYHIKVTFIPADLSLPESPKNIFLQCQEQNLGIDVLVNNAGFAIYGSFQDHPIEQHLNLIQLNLTSATHLIGLFLPAIIKKQGMVLNVASTAAFQPGPLMSVYYATKAYILSLSESLRNELKKTGVHVSCLCPGPTASKFTAREPEIEKTNLMKLAKRMTAEAVAEQAFRGLINNKAVVVPGFFNAFLAFWAQVLPRSLVTNISRWALEK